MNDRHLQMDQLLPLVQEMLAAGKSVTFAPKGTSMLPMIRTGVDQVTLSPLPGQLKKYDLPLYRRPNGQFVLHRIVKVGADYTCCGDNQFVMEPGVQRAQMIGLVTAFTRGGRQIAVDHPLYRAYCRIWHWSRPVRRPIRRIRSALSRRIHKK